MPKYYGQEAVEKVMEAMGVCEMPLPMQDLIMHEGYVDEWYEDDKGVPTFGVGQTGEYASMPFWEVYDAFVQKTRKLTPGYDLLPLEVQSALLSATYRGDWGQSRKARRYFSEGEYAKAANEFLNNADYRQRKSRGDDGVTKRMEWVADMIRGLA